MASAISGVGSGGRFSGEDDRGTGFAVTPIKSGFAVVTGNTDCKDVKDTKTLCAGASDPINTTNATASATIAENSTSASGSVSASASASANANAKTINSSTAALAGRALILGNTSLEIVCPACKGQAQFGDIYNPYFCDQCTTGIQTHEVGMIGVLDGVKINPVPRFLAFQPQSLPIWCVRCKGQGRGRVETIITDPQGQMLGKILREEDTCAACHGQGFVLKTVLTMN